MTVRRLRAVERELYRAMIQQDFVALDRLLADDLLYVHSTAVAETKREYLAGVKKGWYDYARIASRGVKTIIEGNTAVMRGVVDMSVGARGRRKSEIRLLFVLVWARRSGNWRLCHRHATRMRRR